VTLLFALAAGLTLSGIVANLYRLLAHKPENPRQRAVYFTVMAFAGPSVLFNNATKSFRGRDCSVAAYLFAVILTAYWSFALGLAVLYLFKKI
jgi:F0F1-type ATP synthase membrane subunit c/vacuolar-type H+-ATPase subunit K